MPRTLYAVVCAAPPARDVGKLVGLAQAEGWTVCMIATPMATRFIDAPALESATGYPVRSEYKQPHEPDVLPPPDAVVTAPVTFNTMNKWAAGVSDTLALGLLCETLGKGLPIAAAPFVNSALAGHPAYESSVRRVQAAGVRIVRAEVPHSPGEGDALIPTFPWREAFEAVRSAGNARWG